MGALVGGVYAAGSLDEFTEWAQTLTQRTMLRLLDPSISAAGVLRAGKILDAVRDMLGDATIENLPIPFTAVATDLIAGKSVWLQRGPVDDAIRASIAIPGIVAPHLLNGRLLADGGILDPLPMAPIAAVNADLTVAVTLSGTYTDLRADEPAGFETTPTRERLNRLLRSTSALLETPTARSVLSRFGPTAEIASATEEFETAELEIQGDDLFAETSRDAPAPKLGSFAVMNRTIEIAQAALARHQLAAYPPDLLIEIPRTACRSLDFHRAAEVIELGHEIAAQALDSLNLDSAKLPGD